MEGLMFCTHSLLPRQDVHDPEIIWLPLRFRQSVPNCLSGYRISRKPAGHMFSPGWLTAPARQSWERFSCPRILEITLVHYLQPPALGLTNPLSPKQGQAIVFFKGQNLSAPLCKSSLGFLAHFSLEIIVMTCPQFLSNESGVNPKAFQNSNKRNSSQSHVTQS